MRDNINLIIPESKEDLILKKLDLKNITFDQAILLSQSDRGDYSDIFENNMGLDLIDEINGQKAYPSWNGSRKVNLEIRTWVGVSFNAIHYYGTLKIDGVIMRDDKGCGTWNQATRIFEEQNVLAKSSYDLKIKRPLTQFELDDDPERWRSWQAGDLVNNFKTEPEIVELAKQIFKLRFKGNWELFVEYSFGRKEQVCVL